VVRTKGGAARVKQERKRGPGRMHSHTHTCTPLRADARTAPSLPRTHGGWWGGKWLPFGLTAFIARVVVKAVDRRVKKTLDHKINVKVIFFFKLNEDIPSRQQAT